jgi:RluA family pseudouridine synthase
MHSIVLTEAEAGQRLDRYLRKLLRAVPLGAIFRHLRNGSIRIDGKKGKPDLRLTAGMKLSLALPDADLAAMAGAPPAVDESAAVPPPKLRAAMPKSANVPVRQPRHTPRIVHRDDDVLVVSKPAGLAAQPGSGQEDDLVQWLATRSFGVHTATFRPAPAHRLDRGTSGLVAIGLSPHGLRGLTAAFREDQVDKVYIAVVHGVPEPASGTIDAPLWQRDAETSREPKVIVDPRGKPARTDYEVTEVGRGCALLRLVLHTGRLHQIRVHLAHLGHPIVGDRRYGSTADVGRNTILLHAIELAFPHPRTGERVHCRDNRPPSFRKQLGKD